MLIAHILPSIESEAAGPSYTVPRLCRSLAELGHEVSLLTLGDPGLAAADAPYRDRRIRGDLAGLPPARRLGLGGGMRRALAAAEADVFHAHGLWTLPGVHAGRTAARRGRPFVLSPRGMLGRAALAISPLRKRLFWRLVQAPSLRALSCLHATAESEYDEIRAFGIAAPVAVIPNGIDLPAPPGRRGDGRTVLYLGRLHPKKGLETLIRAWSTVQDAFPGWRLRIVGPGEGGYDARLRAMIRDLAPRSAGIEGPLFGTEKAAAYAEAELFVLPTLNENFAMTVAESLAAGTPVIATRGAPWEGLEREGCGWWIDHGDDALAAALGAALALPPEARRAMGEAGRQWMERDFRWEAVAAQMALVYRWLVEGGEPPPPVRTT